MLNPILMQYHVQNRYFNFFNSCDSLEKKRANIISVLHFTEVFLKIIPPCCSINKELALFCAEHFDDGYVEQYRLFGSLDDSNVSHSSLGLERFNKWLYDSSFVAPLNTDIQIFRDVLLYHHNPNFCTVEESKPYIAIICGIEDFINATNYLNDLVRIIENDSNGYIRDNPNLNQHFVSPSFFEKYEAGERIHSSKQCTTYAEYTLWVATLMTNCIKSYPFIKDLLLLPTYRYTSILEGYKQVFKLSLTAKMSKKAYQVLLSTIQNSF